MRVRRQAAAFRQLLAEMLQLFGAEPAFEEGAGVDAGRGVALEVDLVGAVGVVRTAEEVVEADFVEVGRRGEGGDVAADGAVFLVSLDDHGHGVPADEALEAAFHLAVAGEERLLGGGDGVDIRRVGGKGDVDAADIGLVFELRHEEPRPVLAATLNNAFKSIEPFARLGRVVIDGRGRGVNLAVDAVSLNVAVGSFSVGDETFFFYDAFLDPLGWHGTGLHDPRTTTPTHGWFCLYAFYRD